MCRSGVQVKKENEIFTVVRSRSPQNLKCGHFTLLFCTGRQGDVPKCKRIRIVSQRVVTPAAIKNLTSAGNRLRPNISANTHYFSKILFFLFVRTYWEDYFYLKK